MHVILSLLMRLDVFPTNLEVMFAMEFLVVIESRKSVSAPIGKKSPLFEALVNAPMLIPFLCHCKKFTSTPTHVTSTGYKLGQITPPSLGVV